MNARHAASSGRVVGESKGSDRLEKTKRVRQESSRGATIAEATRALREGRYRDSAKLCRLILKQQPDHLAALETKALALWQLGDYRRLVHVTGRLVRLNPHEPGYLLLRGMASQALGQCEPAARSLQRALNGSRSQDFESTVRKEMDRLDAWQVEQVERLLKVDPAFLVRYMSDPLGTVEAHGYSVTDSTAPVLVALAALRRERRDPGAGVVS